MPKSKSTVKSKVADVKTKSKITVVASPLNDLVIAAMFTDADSAGVAAEYLVKDVLGEYGKRFGKVVSVTPQAHSKLTNFRGCRVDVICETDDHEYWLIEFQMYDDEFMFERNLSEIAYTIIRHTEAGTTSEEMAEDIPHIVVINFLNFNVRNDNKEWLQPIHFFYDKEPRRTAFEKLEIFNIQLPRFAENEPNFENDGECWLNVMYQSHIKKITPQEVLAMDTRLERFANTNPGFKQFETRFRSALADPDLLDQLRMEASDRWREAGMKKAIERNRDKSIALNMIARNFSIDVISDMTGLTIEEVTKLQNGE